eukprot:3335537-Amphidinium_carterae.1
MEKSKHHLKHWYKKIVQFQLGHVSVLIGVSVCTQRASTYKCLPAVPKTEELFHGKKTLEFSYNPRHLDPGNAIRGMVTRWSTPQAFFEKKKMSSDPGMVGDAPMEPEDPYWDEEEEKINNLKQVLMGKIMFLLPSAAKLRALGACT